MRKEKVEHNKNQYSINLYNNTFNSQANLIYFSLMHNLEMSYFYSQVKYIQILLKFDLMMNFNQWVNQMNFN